jgi:hypothetical protein
MPTDQIKFNAVCDGCMELAVSVAAGAPTVTVVDTNGTLGTVTAGNSTTFNDYLYNGNTATVSIPDGNTVESGKIIGTIKYTNCQSPTPTPSSTQPTPTPSNSPTPTTTPTPSPSATSGGGTLPSGGASCSVPLTWPGYGTGNKYDTTITTTEQWFQVDSTTRTIYTDSTVSLMLKYNPSNGSCFPLGNAKISSTQPISLSTYGRNFSLRTAAGTKTCKIWIV